MLEERAVTSRMINNAASEKGPKKSQEDGVSFATRRPPSSYIGTRWKTNATINRM
jgi:hypothetical protein